MKMKKKFVPKHDRDAVYQAVLDYWRKHYNSPALRDICNATTCSSPSTMGKIIRADKRYHMDDVLSRSVVPVELARLIRLRVKEYLESLEERDVNFDSGWKHDHGSVYKAICVHWRDYQHEPSLRWLCKEAGVSSPSTLREIIEPLRKKNWLITAEKRLKIPVVVRDAVQEFFEELDKTS